MLHEVPKVDQLRTGRTPVRIMAILNVTPDSFSDGGRFMNPERAIDQARALVAEGADILDIGAESTRPGFTPISAETELRRLMPVLQGLPEAFGGRVPVLVSVDTTKASVAQAALAEGATIVNDIWGFQGDRAMAGVVAAAGAQAILMHNRQMPDESIDILDDIRWFFERSLAIAAEAGVPRHRLILDPGIGFGKTQKQQIQVLANLEILTDTFGLPILVGASRKSFLRPFVGDDPANRLIGTLAAHVMATTAGAAILRVHDVAAHVTALGVTRAIAEARL
ncbi:dihydropteroate synthase [Lichenifustis flavocetrariae]|uniref:Dihydropteroate synthase n=1 Tax=Lichenifustis flavocetrariae TaxID=2949735 RepID=A0AA41YWF1_9HYPH|nr:dihydropteroate synthase [Lichenifustis flavocetrariae]MCW6508550.1 dihydropteroate synthase [Lichenifustis flavocetrariae]